MTFPLENAVPSRTPPNARRRPPLHGDGRRDGRPARAPSATGSATTARSTAPRSPPRPRRGGPAPAPATPVSGSSTRPCPGTSSPTGTPSPWRPGVAEVLARPGTSAVVRPVPPHVRRRRRAVDPDRRRRAHRPGPRLGRVRPGHVRVAVRRQRRRASGAAGRHVAAGRDAGACTAGWTPASRSGSPRSAAAAAGRRWRSPRRFPERDASTPTTSTRRRSPWPGPTSTRPAWPTRCGCVDQDLAREGPTDAYDLVMAFECIHDMPAPGRRARRGPPCGEAGRPGDGRGHGRRRGVHPRRRPGPAGALRLQRADLPPRRDDGQPATVRPGP